MRKPKNAIAAMRSHGWNRLANTRSFNAEAVTKTQGKINMQM